jgi:hypothetical protein
MLHDLFYFQCISSGLKRSKVTKLGRVRIFGEWILLAVDWGITQPTCVACVFCDLKRSKVTNLGRVRTIEKRTSLAVDWDILDRLSLTGIWKPDFGCFTGFWRSLHLYFLAFLMQEIGNLKKLISQVRRITQPKKKCLLEKMFFNLTSRLSETVHYQLRKSLEHEVICLWHFNCFY